MNNLWNSSSIIPSDINLPVLVWTENDKLMTLKDTKTCLNGNTKHMFSDWKHLVDKYHIKYWMYQFRIMEL